MSRRTQITDAAIETLAASGMRGLTHRAVDRTAGLPEGSTSYYFRTRLALLEAILDRLAAATTGEFTTMPREFEPLTVATAERLYTWLKDGRSRQLARYEISLEATRRVELREIVDTSRERIRGPVAAVFAAHEIPDPAARAQDFVAYLDGLLFDVIVGGRTPEPDLDELTSIVRRLLVSVTS